MGTACSQLYNVPRPNPKDPNINICSPNAITQLDVASKTNLTGAITDAIHYCNDETTNPPLPYGFSDLAGEAQIDPEKFGQELYNSIVEVLTQNNVSTRLSEEYIAAEQKIIVDAIGNTLIKTLINSNITVPVIKFIFKKFVKKFAKKLIQEIKEKISGNYNRLRGNNAEDLDPDEIQVEYSTEFENPLFEGPVDIPEDEAASIFEEGGTDAAEVVTEEALGTTILDTLSAAFTPALITGVVLESAFLVGVEVTRAINNSVKSFEQDYCNNIGDAYSTDNVGDTEWTVLDNDYRKNSCYYNDNHRGYATESGAHCCHSSCSIVGSGLRCVRQNFRADPFVCCFKDFSCNGNEEPDTCFQTPERQRTCHPLFRDLSKETCRDIIYNYCAGEELLPGQTDWIEMWLENSFIDLNSNMAVSNLTVRSSLFNTSSNVNQRGLKYPFPNKQPCVRAIARAVTSTKICSWEQLQAVDVVEGAINPEGFIWSQNLLQTVFDRYTAEGGSFLGGINTDGINRNGSFYNTLWQICSKIPGLCTNILDQMCSSYTAEEVSTNSFLIPWCSCYLPEDQYQQYEQFGVTKECTPLCNRTGVIPAVSSTNQPLKCQQTICIIDETSINLVNTQFEGSGQVNLNQLCGSCGASNVYQSYSAANISINFNSSDQYYITPPSRTTEGYTSVYGSNFNLTLSGQQTSLMIPSSDITTSPLPSTIKDPGQYQQCLLVYAKKINSADVGIVSIVIINDNTADNVLLKPGKYYFGYGVDGEALPGQTNNAIVTPQEIQLNKSSNVGNSVTSRNSTTYGQSNYVASLNTCNCVASGFSLKTAESRISGKINFNQQCGSTQCVNESGDPIPCSSTQEDVSTVDTIKNIENQTLNELTKNKFYSMFFSVLGLFVIITIFFIVRFLSKSCYKILYMLLSKIEKAS